MQTRLPFSPLNSQFFKPNSVISFGCGRDGTMVNPTGSDMTGFDPFRRELVEIARAERRAFKWKAGKAFFGMPKELWLATKQLFQSSKVSNELQSFRPNPSKLYEHVKALTKLDRSYTNLPETNAAAQYIQKEWESQGLAVEQQPFDTPRGQFKNLMVSFGPKDAPRLVIGAHYDVCITEYPGGFKPGADDNASSVAAMLELSRLLKEKAPQLKYRVDLVAYANEEPPFFRTRYMGSNIHAQALKDAKVDVKGMLALDCIGYYTDKKNSQQLPPLMNLMYPTVGNFIGVVGEFNSLNLVRKAKQGFKVHSSIPVQGMSAPSFVPGVDFSDHQNYTKHGWPAVMITDTAMNRNPNYHHNSDTIETLNFEKMADVVQGIYGFAVNF